MGITIKTADEIEKMRVAGRLAAEVLGLPDDKECQYIIALGWPADPDDLTRSPRAGGRKGYDEVVHSERWGQHEAGHNVRRTR